MTSNVKTELNTLSLKGENILPLSTGITLETNLNTPYIKCTIGIRDFVDIQKQYSLVGGEDIVLSIKLNDVTLELKFKLSSYHAEGTITPNQKSRTGTLIAYSTDFINSFKSRISTAYSSTTGDKIISAILTNTLKSKISLDADTTSSYELFHTNYEYPFTSINNISLFDDAMLWQDIDKFYYKKVSTILAQPSVETIKMFNDPKENTKSNSVLISMNTTSFFDVGHISSIGMGNIVNMSIGEKGYSSKSTQSKTVASSFGGNSIVPDFIDGVGAVTTYYHDIENISKHRIFSGALDNHNMVILLHGDLSRKTGSVITFDYLGTDNDIAPHKTYSGKWLVTGIKTKFEMHNCMQELKISKVRVGK